MRQLDNRYAILFIRGAKPVLDLKYDLIKHPAVKYTPDGGGKPYIHKPAAENNIKEKEILQGKPLFVKEEKKEDM